MQRTAQSACSLQNRADGEESVEAELHNSKILSMRTNTWSLSACRCHDKCEQLEDEL